MCLAGASAAAGPRLQEEGLLVAQSDHGVHAGGTARGKVARRKGDASDYQSRRGEDQRVEGIGSEEQAADEASGEERRQNAAG